MSYEIVANLRGSDNGIIDLAGNTWTNYGVTLSDGRFGGKGLEFTQPNTYTYLQCAADSRFDFGTDIDFTVSVWIKYLTGNHYGMIICRNGDYGASITASENWSLSPYCTFGHISGYTRAQQLCCLDNSSWVPWQVDNTWHHIAVTRQGTTRRLFCDGKVVRQDDAIYTYNLSEGSQINVGWDGFQNYAYLRAVLDDLCVIRGTALWTEDFTLPENYLHSMKRMYIQAGEVFTIG